MSGPSFTGRVALVTGGGSGIGRAICRVLARDGASVVVADVNLQNSQDTVNMLPGPGEHLALLMDVKEKSSVDSGIKAIIDKYQTPPSLLANSAGISSKCAFTDMDENTFMRVIDVNLKGTFLVSQAMANSLLERGKVQGAIVNIASYAAVLGLPTHCQYAASKGGVVSLTKTCSSELIKKGIRVNCVLPGAIETPMIAGVPKAVLEAAAAQTPIGRIGQPEEMTKIMLKKIRCSSPSSEVAEVVAFLLSDKSSYMVGTCVEVNGGHGQ
ncbi:(3R)-3-hydroxyacyl-CoA dehydrogenase-like isoform X1 [Homarus americanus]|uniref:(3R)-3-hydroxyacyl-CoA dehydrogenase-like isoform X1 n=1 Tax=Homarus americanus TaxID=6706 RepID=UPI001C47A0E7|nr:(3R)-3-hydroxyacyl-CoA dehydrogenase-like isoform X1 [Homarus americanus]